MGKNILIAMVTCTAAMVACTGIIWHEARKEEKRVQKLSSLNEEMKDSAALYNRAAESMKANTTRLANLMGNKSPKSDWDVYSAKAENIPFQ